MKDFFRKVIRAFKSEGIIFVMFLFALFFQLTDNGIYPIMALSVGLCIVALTNKKLVDGTALWLFVFSCLLFIFTPSFKSGAAVIITLFGPFSFYLYGKYLVQRAKGDKDTLYVVILLIIMSFSFLLWQAAINAVITGSQEYSSRILKIEGNSFEMSATLFALIASLGLSGLAVFVGSKSRWSNFFIWLFLLAFILSFLATTTLVNRSGLIVPLIPLAVIILYSTRDHFSSTFIILAVITVIGILLYNNYVADSELMRAYELRSETDQGAGGDRFWRWGDAVTRLFTNPMGWMNASDVGYSYVHNLWLDIARMGGILPFISFLIANIQIVIVQLELFKKKNDDIVVILLSLFVAVLSASAIEPVIEGCPAFFVLSILFWGMSKEYLVENRRSYSNSVKSK